MDLMDVLLANKTGSKAPVVVGGAVIDDTTPTDKTVYSSIKTEQVINQKVRDNKLVVTITQTPLQTFQADYNSSEIRNAIISNRPVEAHFEDVIYGTGEQIYTYETFKNGEAIFRRNVVTKTEVYRINIKIDDKGNVIFDSVPFESPASNDNILVNADFRLPIVTSGKNTWDYSETGIFIDKWKKSNGVHCTLSKSGLFCSNAKNGHQAYITQALPVKFPERLDGETLVCSAFIVGNGVTSGAFVYKQNTAQNKTIVENEFIELRQGTDKQIYIFIKQDCTISAVKLEVGEIPTLLHDSPQNPEIKKLEVNGSATLEHIQTLEEQKANYTYKVIGSDKVTQADAREVLTFLDQYDGKLIEFLTNGDNPSKCVATGRTMTDVQGNTYLVTFNLDGTTTVWSRDNYEKHNFECRSFINEPIVDLDNFTIDVQGDAPYVASVNNPMNNPGEAGIHGIITVIAYSVDKQIQLYRDIDTGKKWRRLITGTADKHSFGGWEVD